MSGRPHVSGSSIDRFLGCQHWAHPAIILPPQPKNPAMIEGTRRHKIAEHVLRGGNPFPDPQDLRLVDAAISLRERVSVLQIEQGYALNPATGKARLIAGRSEEGYATATDTEIPLTIDVVYRDQDTSIVVRDWKLGSAGISYTPSPERGGQLLAGLLAVRNAGAFDCNTMAVEYADDHSVTRATITHGMLDEFAERLQVTWAAISTRVPPRPEPGPHCKWCPMLSTCEAHHAIVKQSTASVTQGKFRLPMAIKNLQDAQDFVAANDLIADYQERMQEQLKVFASNNVVVRGTQQYRAEMTRPSLSTDLGALHDLGACDPQHLIAKHELPTDTEFRVVAKYKGEPKPVFRWRSMNRK